MQFELLPVIDAMLDIYERPRDINRFKAYLNLLKGNTDNDLDMPVGYFNPMAKAHIPEKLIGMKKLATEQIIAETLMTLNQQLPTLNKGIFKVCLALADDEKGGWTNRYTTDYDSKFKLSPLIKRRFCNPLFWVSEDIDPDMIRQRTLEYCYRSIYQTDHPKPKTLQQHLLQERFVQQKVNIDSDLPLQQAVAINQFYQLHKNTTEYPTLINFLYGDNAAIELGYKPVGIGYEMAGFNFAGLKKTVL